MNFIQRPFPALFIAIGSLLSIASPPSAKAEYPTPGLGPLAPVTVNGMTFSNYWMPSHTGMKSLLQKGLELFSQAAVGNAEPHHETAPSTLVGPLTWLMPLDAAVKTLSSYRSRASEQRLVSDCFPQDSLTVAGFQTNYFMDRGEQFDWMYLVLDKQHRLVGVELVATAPKGVVPWAGRKRAGASTGRLEPYYDYVNNKSNASTTQHVEYEILPAGPGVTLIHTALFQGLRCRGNVHWYLAAPFARTLLDLADYQHKAGH